MRAAWPGATSRPDLLDANGQLANPDTRAFLQAYVDRFVKLVQRLVPR